MSKQERTITEVQHNTYSGNFITVVQLCCTAVDQSNESIVQASAAQQFSNMHELLQ